MSFGSYVIILKINFWFLGHLFISLAIFFLEILKIIQTCVHI